MHVLLVWYMPAFLHVTDSLLTTLTFAYWSLQVVRIRPYMTFTNRLGQELILRQNGVNQARTLKASDSRVSFPFQETENPIMLQVCVLPKNTTLNHLVILICFLSNPHFTDDRRNVRCFGERFSSPELGLFSQPICCWLVAVWVVQIQLAGSQWSHPFAIQKEESLHLMIRHDNGLRQSVQVDVRGYEDGSRFLVFFRLGSSRGPYRSIIDSMGALIFVFLNFSFQYL